MDTTGIGLPQDRHEQLTAQARETYTKAALATRRVRAALAVAERNEQQAYDIYLQYERG